MRRRFLVALAAVMTVGVLSLLGGPALPVAGATPLAASQASPGAIEGDFVARINSLRASRGLGPLAVDGELTIAARSWSATMAGQGRIFHTSSLSSGVSANWTKLGENVGRGGEIGSLFQAFIDSPTHLANLVDPAYTHVGAGVVMSGDTIFTTHRFMAVGPTPPPPPPPTAAPAPPPPPPTTAAPTTIAPTTTVPPPPPTTTTTTTVPPPPPSKFGRLDRIRELVEAS